MRKSRFPIIIASGLIVVMLPAIIDASTVWSHTAAGSLPTRSKVFHNDEVRFEYPAAWREAHFFMLSGSFSRTLGYVSNQRMHPPCTTKKTSLGTERDCGWVVKRLRRGGVLAQWSAVAAKPNWRRSSFGGKPIRVDGVRGVR